MQQYLDAVREILDTGTRKESRTGVDTLSTFNINYKIDLRDGFPLLTTKKVSWKNIVVENLWFLSGEADIKILQKHGCKFWDAWADEKGNVPSAYGNFWRKFPVHSAEEGTYTEFHPLPAEGSNPPYHIGWNDQMAWAVDTLRKNPMSRRVVVSAWAPGNAQSSKLPPCHIVMVFNVQNLPSKTIPSNGVYCGVAACSKWVPTEQGRCIWHGGVPKTRPHLCLHLTQRSCDIALGVPYNIAGYAFLLELVSRLTEIRAGIFAHTLVDAHAYTCKPDGSMADMDHVPGLKEQLTRKPRELPQLVIDSSIKQLSDIDDLLNTDTDTVMSKFKLIGYDPHPAIRFRVAV